MRSVLYDGTLVHARRTPAENVFRYRISFYVLDLDDLDALERRLHLFSVNRPNVVALYDRDHFDDDGRSLKEKAVAFCAERGVEGVERVVMLAQLRFLGYVFNPVSFYWCYRADGELACMIAELNNTFGERLPELLRGGSLRYEHDKRLHVSPFFGLDQTYEYAFSQPGDDVCARIHVRDPDGAQPLTAVLHGRRRELSNRSLAGLLLRYPLQPLQVNASPAAPQAPASLAMPSIPMTGNWESGLEAEALQSGAKFLLKPIEPDVLLKLLSELLGDAP